MPVYHVGDLVRPNPDHWDDPDDVAVGIILEMRSMTHTPPEAKILWSDLLDQQPAWMFLRGILPLEEETKAGGDT